MTVRRIARVAPAIAVAGVAAVASYAHMADLAAAHGQPWLLARLLPISVDGMMLVATVVMVDDRTAGRGVRPSARVSMAVGVAASVMANVLAAQPDLVARVISAWPALALLLTVEMLSGGRRTSRPVTVTDQAADTNTVTDQTPDTVADIEQRWPDIYYGAATLPDIVPDRPIVPVDAALAESVPLAPAKPRRRRQNSAEKVRKVAVKMPSASPAQIAAKAGVSERTVRRHLGTVPVLVGDGMLPPVNGQVPAGVH